MPVSYLPLCIMWYARVLPPSLYYVVCPCLTSLSVLSEYPCYVGKQFGISSKSDFFKLQYHLESKESCVLSPELTMIAAGTLRSVCQ